MPDVPTSPDPFPIDPPSLAALEATVDFRMFSMTVDEYAAALAIESIQ